MALAQPITLGDQVRIKFIGWPESVKGVTREGEEIRVPHPKTGKPYAPTWNSRPFVFNVGDEKYVPFELAKKEFGDPRSLENIYRIKDDFGEEQIIPDRRAEVIRLSNYWQNNVIQFREYIPGERFDGPISDLLPIVEVYSMTGERILMVTDDPNGDTVVVENQTRSEVSRNQQLLWEQSEAISELKKTNQILMQKLGIRPEDLESLADPNLSTHTLPGNSLDTPTEATVQEKPRMVYNPRTRKAQAVVNRIKDKDSDPTNIQDLQPDTD